MGLIAKQRTKRLTKPHRIVTSLPAQEVTGITRDYAAGFRPKVGLLSRGEQFQFTGDEFGPCKVSYGKMHKGVVFEAIWEAVLQVELDSGNTESLVTLELLRWQTYDSDLVNKREFKDLRTHIFTEIANRDPSSRRLDLA